MAELGYSCTYRVLNAEYFGVPQRRRRVFVVGYFGDWRPAAAVLLEHGTVRQSSKVWPFPYKQQRKIYTSNDARGHESGGIDTDKFPCISKMNAKRLLIISDGEIRYATPMEIERSFGFPDGYTLITWDGKQAPDGPRYKALGNSMAVPVMRWIGQRIMAVEEIINGGTYDNPEVDGRD
jgi:DNA (cytosine-5)-methyltransferase 1